MNNSNPPVNKNFILLVSFVAALGGLLFGFDTAIISGTIPYIQKFFRMDEYVLGWSVSSILIGCAIGALLAGRVADKYGRRSSLIICAVLFAVSGLGAGLANQLSVFIAFRLVGGLGVGAAAMVAPMYIAELAPAQLRGRLVACYQLAIVFGILIAYLVNYVLDGWGDNNWRWMFASQAIPAVVFLLLLLLVPETPRWLIMKGREQKGRAVLGKIVDARIIDAEIVQIKNSFRSETSKITPGHLFKKPYSAAMFVGIITAIFQQVTGINAIIYYAPVIFKETGIDAASSLLQTIVIGIVNIVATFIAIGLVDKIGRKKLLLIGSCSMGLSLIAIGLCFHFNYFENYVVLIFTLLYVASFGATLGAVVWVYLAEIFPNRVRSLALSLATLALWLADFVVTLTFPVMAKALGTAFTMFCYAAMCVAAFIYFFFKIKETKGRSLENMETLFNQ